LNVLLADDDPTMRMLLSRVLERSGHTVLKAAADGEEAWETCKASMPPMIILDWEMPRLDGLELCRRIRSSDKGDEPFILVEIGRASCRERV
jgi:Response regulators consisting of a CheY-like receiver domain and a winged-helix DNA-binding domain